MDVRTFPTDDARFRERVIREAVDRGSVNWTAEGVDGMVAALRDAYPSVAAIFGAEGLAEWLHVYRDGSPDD